MMWEKRRKEIEKKWKNLNPKHKIFLWVLAIIDIILLIIIYGGIFFGK